MFAICCKHFIFTSCYLAPGQVDHLLKLSCKILLLAMYNSNRSYHDVLSSAVHVTGRSHCIFAVPFHMQRANSAGEGKETTTYLHTPWALTRWGTLGKFQWRCLAYFLQPIPYMRLKCTILRHDSRAVRANSTLFQTTTVRIYTKFRTKNAENHALWHRTSIYSV